MAKRWRSGGGLWCLFEQVSPFIILNITICSEKQDERTKTNKQDKLLRNDATSFEIFINSTLIYTNCGIHINYVNLDFVHVDCLKKFRSRLFIVFPLSYATVRLHIANTVSQIRTLHRSIHLLSQRILDRHVITHSLFRSRILADISTICRLVLFYRYFLHVQNSNQLIISLEILGNLSHSVFNVNIFEKYCYTILERYCYTYYQNRISLSRNRARRILSDKFSHLAKFLPLGEPIVVHSLSRRISLAS